MEVANVLAVAGQGTPAFRSNEIGKVVTMDRIYTVLALTVLVGMAAAVCVPLLLT